MIIAGMNTPQVMAIMAQRGRPFFFDVKLPEMAMEMSSLAFQSDV